MAEAEAVRTAVVVAVDRITKSPSDILSPSMRGSAIRAEAVIPSAATDLLSVSAPRTVRRATSKQPSPSIKTRMQ
jgi:hypothetical protein